MSSVVYTCIAVLAFINFPFVVWVNRRVQRPGTKPIYALNVPKSQIRQEMSNAWVTTPVHALLLLAFTAGGALRIGADTWLSVLGTFLTTMVWTEIWHYFSHRLMHWKPLHFIHREHHKSRITNPWTSVSFSFLEKFIFSAGIIGFMALISHWVQVSVLGLTLYYVSYFFTNTLGHANFEFREPEYRKTWMGKLFNTPAYHAMHHARYINNYGLLTPWLDRWFGTEWADAAEVQTQAALGQPLQSLNERVKAPGAPSGY